jgi:hypothetical protein
MSKPLIVNAETKAEETAWSARVKKRDKSLCQFLRADKGWKPCHRDGTDGAHIWRRWKCGKARFHDDVGIAGCRECHNSWDAYEYALVGVPIDRLRAAWDAITAVNKVNVIGDRP